MDIEIFVLCDAATDLAGKLNILGTFDTLQVKAMPCVHPHCAIAMRVRFSRIEEGDHKFRIDFVNEDGQPLVPKLEGGIKVAFAAEVQSTAVNLVLGLNNLKIEQPGMYAINLAIDGRQVGSQPLWVKKV
ncbi:MAG: hypothetical protein ABIF71_15330 [Planctomycetota bacterium]